VIVSDVDHEVPSQPSAVWHTPLQQFSSGIFHKATDDVLLLLSVLL
jgi:hypothetical protein